MSVPQARVRYQIRFADGRWSWRTFDAAGAPIGSGEALSRAHAAACVISTIARQTAPERQAA